ncbi:hypothetical protein CLERM_245 [Coxiella-like endosymbiont]|nr:hypothetical protein CLERM_245 [Coxiella-like endosymbiont]
MSLEILRLYLPVVYMFRQAMIKDKIRAYLINQTKLFDD